MAKEFTKHLNDKYVKKGELRIVFEMIPVDFDKLVPMLISGKADIIAVGLTRTKHREKKLGFVNPYQEVDDVIVTRKELLKQSWKDKIFRVQKKSSYKKVLIENSIKVEEISPNFNAVDIMGFVSLKKYDYTLVNSFWAKTLIKGFDNLAIIKENPFRKKSENKLGRKKEQRYTSKLIECLYSQNQKGIIAWQSF